MSGVCQRLDDADGRYALAEIALRLESGEEGAKIAAEPGFDAISIVAALGLAGITPEGPPLVQESPRRPKLKTAASAAALAALFPKSSRTSRLALAAGLLQILDFWDESHHAAQEADDLGERQFAAYWHAIAHRREPDPGNAAYWFRRVGRHPVFEPLAATVQSWTDADATSRLLRNGSWDPSAFSDLCRADSGYESVAKRIQTLEMTLLLDATASAAQSDHFA